MSQERSSRQSFLGRDATSVISAARIGIIGLGGGGSHVIQQLAHLGFKNYVIYDPDLVEESNLNRLIGATSRDAENHIAKVDVAARLIRGLQSQPNITAVRDRWQHDPLPLRGCDLVFGCLDGLQERSELEVCSRRFLIPYLDIGLGVRIVDDEAPRMAGQIVLSMPGSACFRCLGFLNERDLAEEAAQYGDAGVRPQVVWANGVLASTAVGIGVDLLTDWTRATRSSIYLSYDANLCTVKPHPRLRYLKSNECPHFPLDDLGEPTFVAL